MVELLDEERSKDSEGSILISSQKSKSLDPSYRSRLCFTLRR